MGIWKDLKDAHVPQVQGQSVSYTDRDSVSEPEQLELPFEPALIPSKEALKKLKTKAELDAEYDELFDNFKTVLTGQDVSVDHKQTVLITLLNNFKSGNPYVSNRSRGLLLELCLYGLK